MRPALFVCCRRWMRPALFVRCCSGMLAALFVSVHVGVECGAPLEFLWRPCGVLVASLWSPCGVLVESLGSPCLHVRGVCAWGSCVYAARGDEARVAGVCVVYVHAGRRLGGGGGSGSVMVRNGMRSRGSRARGWEGRRGWGPVLCWPARGAPCWAGGRLSPPGCAGLYVATLRRGASRGAGRGGRTRVRSDGARLPDSQNRARGGARGRGSGERCRARECACGRGSRWC